MSSMQHSLIQGRIEEFEGPHPCTNVGTPMLGVLPQKIFKSRCSEMRFQANPDDIKSLVMRLTYHTIRPGQLFIGKNEKKIKD
jgi:hypothetical protein